MGKYFEKAVKSFLDDKGLEYEVEFREDGIYFKKLDGNTTLLQLSEFMEDFKVFLCTTFNSTEDGFVTNVELIYPDHM